MSPIGDKLYPSSARKWRFPRGLAQGPTVWIERSRLIATQLCQPAFIRAELARFPIPVRHGRRAVRAGLWRAMSRHKGCEGCDCVVV